MQFLSKIGAGILLFTLSISMTGFAQNAGNSAKDSIPFNWKSMEDARELAEQEDKKVLIYANAVWCTYCKKQEKEVFSQKNVQDLTNEHFYSVWLDIESEEKLIFRGEEITQRDFARAMRITGTPTFIFLDSKGEIIAGQPGFIPEDLYLQILKFVGTDAYLDQSFEEFAEL
ncbi:MAG TPA: thioredoxin fold domain-containing protein [Gracilimonas sp.]|uniref:thioredoxin family protein n=1 Tax=Gracilimonas sp. TaxID=1974203 RepID=UPI002DAB94BB|nr:thioredoxin fold domain-containing protein [Gracilimonas sp.]